MKLLAERARQRQQEAALLGLSQDDIKAYGKKRKWSGAAAGGGAGPAPGQGMDRREGPATRLASTWHTTSTVTAAPYAFTQLTGPYSRWAQTTVLLLQPEVPSAFTTAARAASSRQSVEAEAGPYVMGARVSHRTSSNKTEVRSEAANHRAYQSLPGGGVLALPTIFRQIRLCGITEIVTDSFPQSIN
ncbi:hypothetical protein AAFF_G00424050 [Aldrovandia affinis]|uniref:Methylcytosine dioxygenase TET n=1 Tax=Aldrovandia affinis TaxID=143900 RepID=A0AAD7X052_9TELE|nr:hypothetical protein AAFF_G00424050 [Aldrovandia affinis]